MWVVVGDDNASDGASSSGEAIWSGSWAGEAALRSVQGVKPDDDWPHLWLCPRAHQPLLLLGRSL